MSARRSNRRQVIGRIRAFAVNVAVLRSRYLRTVQTGKGTWPIASVLSILGVDTVRVIDSKQRSRDRGLPFLTRDAAPNGTQEPKNDSVMATEGRYAALRQPSHT
jgi:hypothetical protein